MHFLLLVFVNDAVSITVEQDGNMLMRSRKGFRRRLWLI